MGGDGSFAEDLDALVELDCGSASLVRGPLSHRCRIRWLSANSVFEPDAIGERRWYLVHLREVLTRHEDALAEHMHQVLVARELRIRAGPRTASHSHRRARQRPCGTRRLEGERPRITAPISSTMARGGVDWGEFRRTDPISRDWGYERGTPVDRRYIEAFLCRAFVRHPRRRCSKSRRTTSRERSAAARYRRTTYSTSIRQTSGHNPSLTFAMRAGTRIGTVRLHHPDADAPCHRRMSKRRFASVIGCSSPAVCSSSTLPAASRNCLVPGEDWRLWRVTPAGAPVRLVRVRIRAVARRRVDGLREHPDEYRVSPRSSAEELTDGEFDAAESLLPGE